MYCDHVKKPITRGKKVDLFECFASFVSCFLINGHFFFTVWLKCVFCQFLIPLFLFSFAAPENCLNYESTYHLDRGNGMLDTPKYHFGVIAKGWHISLYENETMDNVEYFF